MESENTAGAKTTSETTVEPGGIEHLGQLLAEGEAPPEGDDDEKEKGGSGGSDDKPKKFNDLAGKLGLELDELYKLEISQAEDGTPVTVESLKDRFSKQDDLQIREVEFEERKAEQEADIMQAQTELREIMAALPEKAIKPEVLQKVRDKHAAQVALERKLTLDVIPDWKDDKTRTADIEGMAEHLKQYGFPVNYLERVADHRQMKYIRDSWKREQRIRKALELVKSGRPNPTTKQKPAKKAASKTPLAGVKRGNNARNKLESVFSELD